MAIWRWMTTLVAGRPRELPLAKRDLLIHDHVDLLPTRWTGADLSSATDWLAGRSAAAAAGRPAAQMVPAGRRV
ncbi:hypothetical protein [Geminicoccus flavidas]|uniref:hypothetical protein n=1 Tax=Geminicoccus flavidas TaxID=2506407 RepID=UPI00135CAA59|nr:hypothetical protein [Geminicoccus flavidas]